MEFQCNITDFTEIIRRFDEHLTKKVDKATMYKMTVDQKKTYAAKDDMD